MRTGDNIRLRTDGRFEARYAKGRDEQGRIIYGCCYGHTREEAVQKREEALYRLRPVRELNLLILGAGGRGEVAREIARSLNVFHEIAFLDDGPGGGQVLGRCADMARFIDRFPAAIPAAEEWPIRQHWMKRLARTGFILPVLIHPTAVVSPDAEVGYGTVVEARAVVGPGTVVGNGCVISGGAVVGHRCVVENGCQIGYNASVPADTRLPEGTRVEKAYERPGCAVSHGGYYFEAGV